MFVMSGTFWRLLLGCLPFVMSGDFGGLCSGWLFLKGVLCRLLLGLASFFVGRRVRLFDLFLCRLLLGLLAVQCVLLHFLLAENAQNSSCSPTGKIKI